MNGTSIRAALAVAALVLAACGSGGDVAQDGDTTAATQPASAAQTQAAPQADTPQANAAPAPPPVRTGAQPYAKCAADARARSGSEEELGVLLRACQGLPGAPRR